MAYSVKDLLSPKNWDFKNLEKYFKRLVQTIGTTVVPEEFDQKDFKPAYQKDLSSMLDESRRKTKQSKEVQIFWCTIDYTLAMILMVGRSANRIMSGNAIHRYMTYAASSNWNRTGQALILDQHDRVIDGQQRLAAVIQTKKPIEILVVRGIPTKMFAFMDCGVLRSAAHVMQGHRYKDGRKIEFPSNAATATIAAIRYAKAINGGSPTVQRDRVDSNIALAVYLGNPGFANICGWYKECQKDLRSIGLSAGQCIASMFFTTSSDKDKSDDFWEGVTTGVNLSKTSPILALRELLIREAAREKKRKEKLRSHLEYGLEAIVKAWNLHLSGSRVARLRMTRKESTPFPKFEGSEKAITSIIKFAAD